MRGSGILMPVFSLPSPYGIGTMGKEAYEFIDFLVAAGQKYWQVLPIGPTGYADSPYQSFSVFAGNPYFIDLNLLAERNLISRMDILASGLHNIPGRIDYKNLYDHRFGVLRKAASKIRLDDGEFRSFCAENEYWLADYALFMSIKTRFGMVSFQEWPASFKARDEAAIAEAKEEMWEEIQFWSAVQFLFYEQWNELKKYANQNNINIIGDMPIYVSPDSADLWVNGHLFQLDGEGRMIAVAGCPPDYFNVTGQRWGNPLYDWEKHKETNFEWWIRRLLHSEKMFDGVRIDHFRGFAGYYSIPEREETAVNGEWKKGPGESFIAIVKEVLPHFMIIAEDLGHLTQDVKDLLRSSRFPGMKVLQFAFDGTEDSEYLPHKYEKNCIVYTGTHDNPTLREWEVISPQHETTFAREYLGVGATGSLSSAMINSAMRSIADICIIPIQDWLMLGIGARINVPGKTEGNWLFRIEDSMLTYKLCSEIERTTEVYGR